ncbi:platelet-activating factor acetylhydrolase, isoform II-domain-containing protein [Protomyces lactucae-debilis]|uniref:1-alkyl-2-acetylglycerophosphocholine esterase n=1 Tax=Protomyces lactucae-debilis TaxID=2754530 RepID=A0A1Y2F3Y2_PROLT|nr:platelet-activating factor acetylhydrolase, isoform II-domain-containing protein [Protomyces lactucae-debilis]ORY78553.1 platelet-activating factor acetylhydrolase, isoform II-domain-containing protein [Protomyces lactucae-debilis]
MPGLAKFINLPIPGREHQQTSNSRPTSRKALKERRPRNVRDNFIKSLPTPSGPYDVGSIDLEIPVDYEDFGIRRGGKQALVLETVLFTIFYPIKLGTPNEKAPDGRSKWSRQTWLPRSRGTAARGYGDFAGVNKAFCQAFFCGTVGLTKLPAWRNAPLANHWAAEGNARDTGVDIKDRAAEESVDHTPVFPLMLFSHGLGGNRSTYSALCSEYASYGYICVAVEHRDGSGPRTFVNHPLGDPAREVNYIRPWQDPEGPLNGPSKNDTSNEVSTDHELRNAQIRMRKRELHHAREIMCRINAGEGAAVAALNRRNKQHTQGKEKLVGATSRGTIGIDWERWRGAVSTDDITLCGHSFGGATCISALRSPDMLKYVSYGILLDVWGQGLPPKPNEEDGELATIQRPTIALGSESFLYWEENNKIMFDLARNTLEIEVPFWLLTIRGSFHMSFSDFGLLWPRLFKFMFKASVDSQRAVDIIINASMEFLRIVMPQDNSRWIRATNEGLLDVQISDKWRNIKGKRNDWMQKMKVHGGDDCEVWMHVTPTSGYAGIEGHVHGATDATASPHHVSTSRTNDNTQHNKDHSEAHKEP